MQRKHFDVVITDCHMPHLDGRELLSMSRAAWPHTPVIMLSGDAVEAPHRLQQLGVYAWVSKPYDTWFLLEIIRDACAAPYKTSPVVSHVKGL
ncbi:MAG TPA: response regulator [Nitrospira sp.]|nr:response regulator [Nitrospira sp.]